MMAPLQARAIAAAGSIICYTTERLMYLHCEFGVSWVDRHRTRWSVQALYGKNAPLYMCRQAA